VYPIWRNEADDEGKENYCESKIISKTDLRKMQNHQKKRKNQSNLRKSETQTKTRIIPAAFYKRQWVLVWLSYMELEINGGLEAGGFT